MELTRPALLCLLLACAGVAPAHAQPQGVLQPPPKTPAKPVAAPTPPKAAPVAPVQRVAPFADPQTGRVGSLLAKPPPVVKPPARANASKPKPKPGPSKPAPLPTAAGAAAAAAAAGVAVGAVAVGTAAATATTPDKPAEKPAPPPRDPTKGTVTDLPIPRWASLKNGEVNMRTGPGLRYPTDWVYRRKELPVQIEREFDVWRLVQDPEGVRGWVHQQTLTAKRTFVLKGADQTLRAKAADDADAVALIKSGVVGTIRACAPDAAFCEVEAGGHKGWMRRAVLWGMFPGEAVGK
jgi:SH3-like domain-containing protein